MKLSLVLLFALLACAAVATSAQFEEADAEALVETSVEVDPHTLPAEFEAWVAANKRVYRTAAEKAARYKVWAAAKARLDALKPAPGVLQAAGEPEAEFGIDGPFADLDPKEFKDSYLSALKLPKGKSFLAISEDRQDGEVFFETEEDRANAALLESESEAEVESELENELENEVEVETEALAELTAEQEAEVTAKSFSWKKISTPVKSQGQCGSCWAHAAISVLESAAAKAGKKLKTLSQQQLVDCSHSNSHGCRGGDPSSALRYFTKYKSTSYKSYPYKARNGKCRKKSGNGPKVKTTGNISGSEAQVLAALRKYGPLAVAVAAGSSWQYYKKGVMSHKKCGKKLTHAVVLVGYSSKGYWIVRNSWGKRWGEKGYIRLKYGHNACGLKNWVTYATA